MTEAAKPAQEKTSAKSAPHHAAKTAAEERLEAEVRAAEQKSAKDKAALERVRRKLTRLMLTSVTMTFIALAVVAAAIVYKIAHTRSAPQMQTAQQTQPAPQMREQALPPPAAPFIQTAPNSGAEQRFSEEAQRQAAKQTAQIPLAAGERVETAQLSGNLVLLRLTAPQANLAAPQANAAKFIIYDYAKRQVIARFTAAPQ